MKRILSLLCILLLLTGCLLPSLAGAYSNLMIVKTSDHGRLNVRSSPSTASNNVIGQISYGTTVEVLQVMSGGSWGLVRPTNWNSTGYVMMRYLASYSPVPTPQPAPVSDDRISTLFGDFYLVSNPFTVVSKPSRPSGWVNMRWAPSTYAAVQQNCYQGHSLNVIAEGNAWYQVQDPSTGYVGFIMKAYTAFSGYGSSY